MERHKTVGAFWKSHFLRLFPPYWFSLAVAVILGAVGAIQLEEGFFLHPLRNIAANITMFALMLRAPQALGVYWTLAIELIFYALCSFLKLTKLIENRLAVAYAGIAIYLFSLLACTTKHFSPVHFQSTYGGLLLTALLGSVVYQVYIGKRKASSLLILTPIVLATIISGVWMRYGLHPQAKDGPYFGFTAQASAWTAAILCFFLIYACREMKFSAPLLWLGRISYSLYLMHAISMWLIADLPLPKWLYYVLAIAFSLLTAEICYRFIEKPFTALAGRVRATKQS
jgi:peptidoglycan/LPS O-acetylase OafA/YrhL